VLLVLAASRPREGQDRTRTVTNGVAIMAVIDRSLSMTDGMEYRGQTLTRFGVVKRVLRSFIVGDGEDLPGRAGDLVGIVQFARLADTQAPPTPSHDTLLRILDSLELAPRTSLEAGTSIGEALALAAARLERLGDQLATAEQQAAMDDGFADDEPIGDPDFVINSKAIILLTDGDEKTGDITALEAAALCAEWDITVYTIGIGGAGGRYGFDESTLRSIAEQTGGLYRRATDGDSLRSVYAEIDSLETTEVRSLSYTTYREWYAVPLALGLGLLVLEVLLGSLVLRRVV
jgi:Ca-activated chloride channel family protein